MRCVKPFSEFHSAFFVVPYSNGTYIFSSAPFFPCNCCAVGGGGGIIASVVEEAWGGELNPRHPIPEQPQSLIISSRPQSPLHH